MRIGTAAIVERVRVLALRLKHHPKIGFPAIFCHVRGRYEIRRGYYYFGDRRSQAFNTSLAWSVEPTMLPVVASFVRRCRPRSVASALSSPSARSFSSSSDQEDSPSTYKRKWTLLYHRSPNRSTYPRAMLGFSSLNAIYWPWYVFDFTPAVNASAQTRFELGQIDAETLDLLSMDTSIGYVGLGMAMLFWCGAVAYPTHLISAIWKLDDTEAEVDENEQSLAISTHKLPFINEPSVLDKAVFDPEDNQFKGKHRVAFTEAELEADSNIKFFSPGDVSIRGDKESHDIIVKFDGDFGKKHGHLALQKGDGSSMMQNYLLDIGSEDEVMEGANPHLLRGLLFHEYKIQQDAMYTGGKSKKLKDSGDGTDGKQLEPITFRKRTFKKKR